MSGSKVHVPLPHHWMVAGESIWADPLGGDLYRLANVPFFAYGLNYMDVVRAVPQSEGQIPQVVELVERSGHRTLRVIFDSVKDRPAQADLLETLRQYGGSYERADGSYVAIDIQPDGDYSGVIERLDQWSSSGKLNYETCEPRTAGSFDDLPPPE